MTRQPKVLLYSATPRSDRGGVQRMLEEMEEVLPDQGFDIVRAGPDETPATGGRRFVAQTDARPGGSPRLYAIPGACAALLRLAGMLRAIRPDVINIHFITGEAIYFLLLRRLFGYRVMLSGHNTDLLRPSPQLRPHLPRLLSSADSVTVVSQELIKAVRGFADLPPERLHYIPNGIDIDFWRPGKAPIVPKRIVAAGRLLPMKGFDLLIEAMRGLPDAMLHILGDGPERAALQARIDAAGLGRRIRLIGHLTPDAVRAEFRQAVLFAMPSRREGMPLALLEALACGCPAVAAGVGAIPDVLSEQAGQVVPPEDTAGLRAALAAALSGRTPASRAGARARAEQFSRQICYDTYGRLIGMLARTGPGQV